MRLDMAVPVIVRRSTGRRRHNRCHVVSTRVGLAPIWRTWVIGPVGLAGGGVAGAGAVALRRTVSCYCLLPFIDWELPPLGPSQHAVHTTYAHGHFVVASKLLEDH